MNMPALETKEQSIETRGLTLPERAVLESLSQGPQDLRELEFQTGLSQGLVMNVIRSLLEQELVGMVGTQFVIQKMKFKELSSLINSKENLKFEIIESLHGLVEGHLGKKTNQAQVDTKIVQKERDFRLRKVSLTPEERKILNTLFYNIEVFLEGVQKQKSEEQRTVPLKETIMVTWGHAPYGEVIQDFLGQLS